MAKTRCDPRHGTQKEGCHNRRIQQGLGSAVRGQTELRPVVRRGFGSAIKPPRNASSASGLSILPAGHSGTPCVNTLRQQVRGVINHLGGLVSKQLCTLANNLLVWAQNNLSSLKATHMLGKMNQGAGMLSRNNVSSEEWTLHQLAVQRIWEIFGRARVDLFAKDNSHCSIFFTRSTDALVHEGLSLPLYAFPPSHSATAGTQASQETTAQADSNSPPLEEPTVGVGFIPAAESSPVADSLKTGPALSSKRHSHISGN